MGEKEGEPEAWIPFLKSSIPGRTKEGGEEADLGKVRPRLRGHSRRTHLVHASQTGETVSLAGARRWGRRQGPGI